ncbi:hypothetical protein GCM10010992_12330 [Cloacibacterium rupense]|uniref:Uncharacterized protein n=1 Tax=Cloacibacterium rupense TaxID=517423 RepID=A0ABQ2NJ47_9FLAO|nr:hypothetical protein [Cloacibacterium rupense]GGP03537.1 hypothetical protein GCM10010992_12330 [Cloacibacterium rupense]
MKNINFYFLGKTNTFTGYLANFRPNICKEILETAYQAVTEGNAKVLGLVKTEPNLFSKKTLQSMLLNNAIIDIFKARILANEKTRHRVKFFETYRMTYALVDNSFFLCFKALGKENTVEGMKTKRFEDVLQGLPFTMSKKMSAEISKLNLKTSPPILFVGFKKTTDFIDFVNLQYYHGGGIALEYGIREVSKVNTENIIKSKNKQNGESDSDSAIA